MNKAADIVLACLREKGMTQRELARRMGEDVRSINQQINKSQDMKVKRLEYVLEHIGYHLEVVDNGGIQRICKETGNSIISSGKPLGKFYIEYGGGLYVGIDDTSGNTFTKEFCSYEQCMKWLRGRDAADNGN